MTLYHYTARAADGAFVAGSLNVQSREQALGHLRGRMLFVTSLDAGDRIAPTSVVSRFAIGPIDGKSRLAFFRSFATLVSAGVPIRRALSVATETCRNSRLREALRSVAGELESGSSLSAALGTRPREFPELFVAMLAAAELGGMLDIVMERLAGMLERERAIQKRVIAALTYPAIVLSAALALVFFLVANTVPAFASMFGELHIALPFTTRLLVHAASLMRSPLCWAIGAASVGAASAAFAAARRYPPAAALLEAASLRVPLAGVMLQAAIVARFARTLGELLRAGVPLLDALERVASVAGMAAFRDCVTRLGEALRRGETLSSAMSQQRFFGIVTLQLVRAGEESGMLDAMLLRIAEYEELEVETALATLSSALEPLLILFLGAMIGVIVASVLIPLYSVIGSIK
jgi:type IV pilus assembly protein PilC